MVTSNGTGKSRPSRFQRAKEHYTITPRPFIGAMPVNERQTPFELSLILSALLFASPPEPTLPLPHSGCH